MPEPGKRGRAQRPGSKASVCPFGCCSLVDTRQFRPAGLAPGAVDGVGPAGLQIMRIVMRTDLPLGDCGWLCAHTVTRGDVADSGAKPCRLHGKVTGTRLSLSCLSANNPTRARGDVASR